MYKCFMGIDPGASGAVAFYFPEFPTKVSVVDFSLVDGEINCSALADLIKGHDPQMVVIEQVHSMPKQGVASTFKFGVAYGMARGVVASLMVPQVYVTPGKWKKFYGLTAEKEKSRELAIQTWPASDAFRRKKDHGRAEAALLALYGAKLNGA